MHEALARNWGLILAGGILMILLGMAAMSLPTLVTWGVIVLLAWVLIIGGVFNLASGWKMKGAPGWGFSMALAALRTLVGIVFLFNPVAGASAITLMIGIFVLVDAGCRLAVGWTMRGRARNSGWILVGGVASLVLGVLILANWPSSALWMIGLFVGISLVFDGWAMVMLALAAKTGASSTPAGG